MRDFLRRLSAGDRAILLDAMQEVAAEGLRVARHLRGEIYEVRAAGENRIYRVLFAAEGHFSQVLLALEAYAKTTHRTPRGIIELAEQRLRDWRARGRRANG